VIGEGKRRKSFLELLRRYPYLGILFQFSVLKISIFNWENMFVDLKKTNFIEYFVLKPFSERR